MAEKLENDNHTPDGKTYEFESINQILNVVDENNIDILILDFAEWLSYYMACIVAIRKANPEETKDKSNIELLKAKFIWTNDGINELKKAVFINQETGEVIEKELS